jgi:putative endonuclease
MLWIESLRAYCRRIFARPSLGRRGEDLAARYLRKRGYTIVARGHRGRTGEIDLIAVSNRTVVFVEVKTRTAHDAGHPAEAVDERKQQRIIRTALAYLKRHDLLECAARFDIIAITWPADGRKPVVEHFLDAFRPTDFGQMFS